MRNKYHWVQVPKPRRSCTVCHKQFEHDDQIVSTLVDDAADKIARIDRCPECFDKEPVKGDPQWRLHAPEEKVCRRLSWRELDERAFLLLDECLVSQEEEARHEAALLALHLLRRKKIALVSQDAASTTYRVVETEKLLVLFRPAGAATEELQQALQKKLFST